MECNKYKAASKRQPQKALQIFNRGQYLSIRLVIYTLETENKKSDRPNRFFTILMFIIK
jgi:hypothetical protein